MVEESFLGYFDQLPKGLRIWFFARLDPRALAKLRRNNKLKKFVDDEVRPHIGKQIELVLEERLDYWQSSMRFLTCIQCSCRKSHVVRGVTCMAPSQGNFSRIDNSYGDFFREERYEPYIAGDEPYIAGDNSGIHTYSFALNPSEHGHVNLSSRLDSYGICYRCVFVNGLPRLKTRESF